MTENNGKLKNWQVNRYFKILYRTIVKNIQNNGNLYSTVILLLLFQNL